MMRAEIQYRHLVEAAQQDFGGNCRVIHIAGAAGPVAMRVVACRP